LYSIAAAIFLALAFLVFARARLLTYLHFFQQEEYDNPRFLRWILSKRAFDQRASLLLLAVSVPLLVTTEYLHQFVELVPIWLSFAAIGFIVIALREPDPRQHGKKRLAMTARAKRILWIALAICALMAAALVYIHGQLPLWILAVQALPLTLALSNLSLQPLEKTFQQRYWDEAHTKLAKLRPTVIGITGSFGKTSVKHILGHLLDSQAATLITPGSINTPMGIARIIREQLGPQHRYFVCEMGAYGPGSIARLCRLAPPDMAVITAVGRAHYERFRSLDTVAAAKFELAEAASERNGKLIVAADVLQYPAARNFHETHKDAVIVIGGTDGAMRISNARQERTGIVFDGAWQGRTYTFRAPLFGLHHCGNVALAFATACMLGCKPEDLIASLVNLPQVKHRLEVTQAPGSWTVVDDAYNSNPVGFAAALELLDVLQNQGGKRILITPGMVELGAAHDEEHAKIGTLAARHVDVLLPVIPERINTLVENFRTHAPNATIVPCRTFAEARAWLDANGTAQDVVLIENDLPDIYEATLRL